MAQVVFLHPDLGIGGAERLVVDAALALKKKGHHVQFITSHHDSKHCFTETTDGTFPVTVVGDWLPRSIFGKFYAVCAYIRMIYAAVFLIFFSGLKPDIIFCDLVSVCIPILRFGRGRVLFYCHFPDQLLSQPGNMLKSIYRAPLNWLEEFTTGQAHRILVNSKFTASVFKKTFSRITVEPEVLYPSLNIDFFDQDILGSFDQVVKTELSQGTVVFLSINRYERKKNLCLALDSLAELKHIVSEDDWNKVYLVMAGGYDPRVEENVEHYDELVKHGQELGIHERITFLKSPTDLQKLILLKHCHCLLYTPSNEHFGIVPLEAMYVEKPVIAVNSGGPTETVVDGLTGFLCESTVTDFAKAMRKCVGGKSDLKKLGQAGRKRVQEKFSFNAFTDQLEDVVKSMIGKREKHE